MANCELISFLNNNLNRDMTQVIFGMVKEMEQIDTTKKNHKELMIDLTLQKKMADLDWQEQGCEQEEDPINFRDQFQPDFFTPTEKDDINVMYEYFIAQFVMYGYNRKNYFSGTR